MEEKEKTLIIDILDNKFRTIYSYKRTPKDFELQEYVEVVNTKTKEKRYDWKRIGWYTSIDMVMIGCLKNIGLNIPKNKSSVISLDDYMKETNELYEKLKNISNNIKKEIKEVR